MLGFLLEWHFGAINLALPQLPDVVVKQTGVISRKKSSDILLSADPNKVAGAVIDRGPRSATLPRSVQAERFCKESLTADAYQRKQYCR